MLLENEPACNRCGLCCYLRNPKTKEVKKCRNLIKLKSGKTLCRIYPTRLGKNMGKGKLGDMTFKCSLRENQHINYPDCRYNKKEWKWYDERV